MKLECLINLLEEKELVETNRRKIEGITVCIKFKSEYKEVIDKIVDNLPDNAVMVRNDFSLTITTFDDVYNWLKCYLDGESKECIKLEKYFNIDERLIVTKAMEKLEEFEVSYNPWTCEFSIIDIEKRNEELRAEKERHEKVVDFLNSLP